MEKQPPPQRGEEEEPIVPAYEGKSLEEAWPWKGKKGTSGGVMLEGYVDGGEEQGPGGEGDGVGRTKSLTDDDLEELKGCLDLGFGFSYEEIPDLCTTLPALELCYSMNQRLLLDEQQQPSAPPMGSSSPGVACEHGVGGGANHIANWKISSPW